MAHATIVGAVRGAFAATGFPAAMFRSAFCSISGDNRNSIDTFGHEVVMKN